MLFDQGEVSKRLYKDVIRRKTVDIQFACKYWNAFFRETISKPYRHRRPSSLQPPSESTTNSTAQDSSEDDSRNTDSGDASERDKSLSTRRLDRVRKVIHTAIRLRRLVHSNNEDQGTSSVQDTTISGLDASRTAVCTAACHLLGGKDSMVYLSKNRSDLRKVGLRSRHLVGKTGQFWAMLSAVYSKDFETAESYLEGFRVIHQKESKWLARLGQEWSSFTWRSSNDERLWLEALAACMILAANIGAIDFFRFLIDLEPGVCTTAFRRIRYGDCNVLEATISHNQSEMFEFLIERGWCLVQSFDELKPINDYGRAMIIAGQNSASCGRRDDILRILFIMTDTWQHKHCVEMLLAQAATRNDVKMIEMILVHSVGNTIQAFEYGDQYGSRDAWRCHKTRNILLIAARLRHMDVLRALLRHRKYLTWIVPALFRVVHVEGAVSGLLSDIGPIPLDCLEELLKCSEDVLVQEQFYTAAQIFDPETVAVFARNIDLNKSYIRTPPKIWLDDGHEVTFSPGPGEESTLLEHDSHRTVGEHALCMALSYLKIDTVRMLVEQFGTKLTWGAVQGMQVWEHDEENIKVLDDLRKLLAEHGMFMQTKIIFAPSFHPLAGNSAQTNGCVRENTGGIGSDSESERVQTSM